MLTASLSVYTHVYFLRVYACPPTFLFATDRGYLPVFGIPSVDQWGKGCVACLEKTIWEDVCAHVQACVWWRWGECHSCLVRPQYTLSMIMYRCLCIGSNSLITVFVCAHWDLKTRQLHHCAHCLCTSHFHVKMLNIATFHPVTCSFHQGKKNRTQKNEHIATGLTAFPRDRPTKKQDYVCVCACICPHGLACNMLCYITWCVF